MPAEIAGPNRSDPVALRIAREVIAARWQPATVLLVETPADYLANRGDRTVCVLAWDEVNLVEMFEDEPPIQFASDRLRRKFDARWNQLIKHHYVPRYRVVA
jgi:hypothetical protein